MARKKKEPITGISSDPDEKLVIQKSLSLYSLWRSDMTLSEFKILDTYLSRINTHQPEKRLVRFEKGELEQLLGVKKINVAELKMRMKHLLGNVVEIQDKTVKKGFRLVTLFETAECEQDENGLWQVNLECTLKAMRYFFNIDNIGYFRYKLRCVTCLDSRYSYILFNYLEKQRHMGLTWTVGVEELKQILNCENDKTYNEFKRFNQKILKRCHDELNEKTECKFDYEPIKKGRRVTEIRFTLEALKNLKPPEEPEDPNQYTLEDYDAGGNPMQDYIDLLAGACSSGTDAEGQAVCEFTQEEMRHIAEVIDQVPAGKLPANQYSVDLQRYHYLREKYAALNRAAARKPITHRCSYLIQMIRKDCE